MKSFHVAAPARALAALVASGFCAIVAGCVVGTPDPGVVYKYPALSDFCTAVAQAECGDAVVTACYGSDAKSLEADRAKCISQHSPTARCNPDGLQYHPAAAESCVAAHKIALQDAKITTDGLATIAKACLPVLNKGGAASASCMVDTDCDGGSGLSCILHGASGTCAVPKDIAAGESCTDASSRCTAGHYCDSNSHCVASGTANNACNATTPCADGLSCSATKVCTTKTMNGQPCATGNDCAGGFCTVSTGGTGSMPGSCTSTDTLSVTSKSCDTYK